MRVCVYVDGFNVYYRGLRNSHHKWLDINKLAASILQEEDEIVTLQAIYEEGLFCTFAQPGLYYDSHHGFGATKAKITLSPIERKVPDSDYQ